MSHLKQQLHNVLVLSIIAMLTLGSFSSAFAENDKHHKVVIQVSTNDPLTQKIALNNAVNLQKHYGMDNVDIEIVAYGPGLGIMTKKSKEAGRVKSLSMQNMTFSACGNTMAKVEKKTGKKPVLTEGVGKVPSGVVRILELQEEGYAYLRP